MDRIKFSNWPTSRVIRTLMVLATLLPAGLAAQGLAGARNLDKGFLIYAGYGPYASAGDLGDRFGNGWSIDGGATFILANSNWEFGFRTQYGFGNDVREDVLRDLRTDEGFIIGNQREPADVTLRQRQLFVGPTAGYTVYLGGKNQRSGIHLKTSVGYFYSRIRIQGDPIQGVAPLVDENLGGYDRLAGGLAVHQFIGWQQLAVNGTFNFYLGADLTAGFTRQLRAFDVPSGGVPDDALRNDLVLGLKAGIVIPIYLGEGREIFY